MFLQDTVIPKRAKHNALRTLGARLARAPHHEVGGGSTRNVSAEKYPYSQSIVLCSFRNAKPK
ncbi:MAG: hypothetical protein A3C04_01420 [Candidatus Wildermuthbacteria bacterium RIFCSPHIGHO2_02_FULL_45_25]|uniref:Uncharacterized protein n=1 Tax=Candidatus Wildermuthbacteria bacterium RIFCSPHIGHO2_02_FULL_45_25 TaxID=1802450 RepID=A0A1G2R2J0_9BACT|nr:MAG: hypothetical protein A3C04_01420 [Candidatus Wildermuthbacteria bacterium RIFCSPHIGHO2_02_FULL_45_25]